MSMAHSTQHPTTCGLVAEVDAPPIADVHGWLDGIDVSAVGGLLDVEPLLLEKEHVGPQRLDLVVDPQHGLGTWHGRKLYARSEGDHGTWPPSRVANTLDDERPSTTKTDENP